MSGKKYLVFLLAMAIIFVTFSSNAKGERESFAQITYGCTTSKLNIRAEPTTDAEKLGMYEKGATIQILGSVMQSDGEWYMVGSGYVKAEYVTILE